MIEKISTYKPDALGTTYTTLFLMMAILLTVQKFKKISLLLLQIYIWGLQNEDNRNKIIRWRNTKKINTAPWLDDNNASAVIAQCIANNLLEAEEKKSGTPNLLLGPQAYIILSNIRELELTEEINNNLATMGKLTETMVGKICLDF